MNTVQRARSARPGTRTVLGVAGIVSVAMMVVAFASSAFGAAQARRIWSTSLDGQGRASDVATMDALSPDGSRLFVTGRSAGLGTNVFDYATIAYDAATGARVWAARYNGPAGGDDQASGIAVSPDGSTVYVTGQSAGGSTGQDYATVAYDAAAGSQLWAARYNGSGNGPDIAVSIAMSADGATVVVAGESYGATYDYATVAYAASSGTQLWATRYDGTGHGTDEATSVAVGSDGTVYVFGDSQGLSTSIDLATVAYGAGTGTQLWAARYLGVGYDGACLSSCVGISPDGSRVYVTGQSFGMGTAYDLLTVAYDHASGAMLWQARYDGPTGGFDFASDLAVLSDGLGVVVTGASSIFGTALNDIVTVRYSAVDGAQRWVSLSDGASHGDDVANSIAATPNGATVVVTGWSNNDGTNGTAGRDFVAMAYATGTGQLLWTVRSDGRGHGEDEGNHLVISPDGATSFMTGAATGKGASLDYMTVSLRV